METMVWLINWFKQNCDGDWEHTNGITISTLDNPGWSFTVDLTDTMVEGKKYSSSSSESEDDWHEAKSDGNTFEAFGDASKLLLLIELFKSFVEAEN